MVGGHASDNYWLPFPGLDLDNSFPELASIGAPADVGPIGAPREPGSPPLPPPDLHQLVSSTDGGAPATAGVHVVSWPKRKLAGGEDRSRAQVSRTAAGGDVGAQLGPQRAGGPMVVGGSLGSVEDQQSWGTGTPPLPDESLENQEGQESNPEGQPAVIDAGKIFAARPPKGLTEKVFLTAMTGFAVATIILTHSAPGPQPSTTRQLSAANVSGPSTGREWLEQSSWVSEGWVHHDANDERLLLGEWELHRLGVRPINCGHHLAMPFLVLNNVVAHIIVSPLGARLQRLLLKRWPRRSEASFAEVTTFQTVLDSQMDGAGTLRRVGIAAGSVQMLVFFCAVMSNLVPFALLPLFGFVAAIWREKEDFLAPHSIALFFAYRMIGLLCTPLSNEPAAAALALWARLVPMTGLGLSDAGGSLTEAGAADASYALLLCVLFGLVCWSRVWVGFAIVVVWHADMALVDLAARGGWLERAAWLWGGVVEKYDGSSFLAAALAACVACGYWLRAAKGAEAAARAEAAKAATLPWRRSEREEGKPACSAAASGSEE